MAGRKGNTLLIVVVIVAVFSISAALFYYIQSQQLIQQLQTAMIVPASPANSIPKPSGSFTKCRLYGYGQKSDFLNKYTVQLGDTLLSISQEQLGDGSRVNELIALNKDRYPDLSLSASFLQRGWQLFLPPDYVKSSSGKFIEYEGNLAQIRPEDGAWQISGPKTIFSTLKVTNETQLPENKINVGDCIKAVVDDQTGVVFSVQLQ